MLSLITTALGVAVVRIVDRRWSSSLVAERYYEMLHIVSELARCQHGNEFVVYGFEARKEMNVLSERMLTTQGEVSCGIGLVVNGGDPASDRRIYLYVGRLPAALDNCH